MDNITQELPKIEVGHGYQPLDPDNPITVQLPELTDDQINFIDNFAEKHDLSFQSALNIVWRDAMDSLTQQVSISQKYTNSRNIRSKVEG